jgi:UDP-2,3-diacylglucosamine pyrophosphatase LpxH
MKNTPRKVKLVVISDVHLGTYGCRAKELISYLKSIEPKTLILNGDFIDMWQFSKRYWPKSHMKVLKQILNFASRGTKVYYITGNHDETLRKFEGLKMGNIQILNKLELDLDDKKAFFFHGDIFDAIIQYSKWLARIGAIFYDSLILLNALINKITKVFRLKNIPMSKKIKNNVKSAVKFINQYEESVIQFGFNKGYDFVICGHIHQPENRVYENSENKKIRYLNSGDWIENMTALEYNKKKWSIYYYVKDFALLQNPADIDEDLLNISELDNKALFQKMLAEI